LSASLPESGRERPEVSDDPRGDEHVAWKAKGSNVGETNFTGVVFKHMVTSKLLFKLDSLY